MEPMNLILIVVMVVFLIFVFTKGNKSKRESEQKFREMCENLSVGDEVTTSGGIIGKVVSVKGETFVLETTKAKTRIRFLKIAISSVDVKAADIANAMKAAENENADADALADTTAEITDGTNVAVEAEETDNKDKKKKK